jgi:hypothetical protein
MGCVPRDNIYKLSNKNLNDLELKKEVLKSYPDYTWEEIANVIAVISDLKKKAYQLADMHRKNMISKEKSIESLKESYSGFSNNTYRDAWAKGMFESMW